MTRPALSPSEEKNKPILIVDKIGVLGRLIASELSKDLLVLLVSGGRKFDEDSRNIIHIPYLKKFAAIPDNTYSYIVIFDENDSGVEESFPAFIKKSGKDNSELVYITHLSEKSQRISEKIAQSYKKTKTIIYGDIFGEEKALAFDNPVNLITKQVKHKRIKVPGDGLFQVYPVLLEDVLKGIFKAIFSVSKSKIFFVFPKNPISLIFLAHIIQKKDPTVTVDFSKNKGNEENRKVLVDGEYLLDEKYDISGKIKKINFEELSDGKFSKSKFSEEEKDGTDIRKFLYPLIFLVFFLVLPILSTFGFMFLGAIELSLARQNLENGNIVKAASSLRNINYLLGFSENSAKLLKYEAGLLGIEKKIDGFIAKVDDYKKLSYSVQEIANVFASAEEVFKGNTSDPQGKTLLLSASYKNSLNLLEEVKVNGRIDENISEKIKSYDRTLGMLYGLQDSFISLINPQGKRKYLVLFQNNMELRPGGGFIGSYGILSLDKGKFVDLSIHDVYDADGQLKGHVEPPYPIRRYLPSAHLYLRDSNFDVEFTRSASSAAFLLFEELNQEVDGVIGIDVSFVRELIGALGEVYVPEYKERVDQANFFHITEAHSEKNFFPSSTQKKDFLNALFSAIKTKLAEQKKLPYTAILKAGVNAISQKHIVFAFSDSNLADAFTAKNLSSSLSDQRKNVNVSDFLGVNEANLGVNKANFFVGRSIKYEVSIRSDGTIASSANLSLRNNSDKWPGGDYKAYIRFISPSGSILSSVVIDGAEQKLRNAVIDPLVYEAKNFRPPEGLEVERYNQSGKTIFGFLTIVPSGKSKSIVVNYTLSQKMPTQNPESIYSLKVFKQPGTENYPFDFALSHPPSLSVLSSSAKIINQEGKTILSKVLSEDETIDLKFSKL